MKLFGIPGGVVPMTRENNLLVKKLKQKIYVQAPAYLINKFKIGYNQKFYLNLTKCDISYFAH